VELTPVKGHKPISWASGFEPELILVPPLSPDFYVPGGPETLKLAREWAVRNNYFLVKDAVCAHIFYLAQCPKGGWCCTELEHTSVWVPRDEPRAPFLLTQPYLNEITDGIRKYALAHGLYVGSFQSDSWHNPPSTLPIRLTAGNLETCSWPLGLRAQIMTAGSGDRYREWDLAREN
jgi:hypothetical protein